MEENSNHKRAIWSVGHFLSSSVKALRKGEQLVLVTDTEIQFFFCLLLIQLKEALIFFFLVELQDFFYSLNNLKV